jgi:hypothetical protein
LTLQTGAARHANTFEENYHQRRFWYEGRFSRAAWIQLFLDDA